MPKRKQPQDNGTSNMEGKNHQIECDCGIWTDIWVPTRIPRNFRDKKFLCGFCAQEKIEKVEEKIEKLEEKLNQPTHNIEPTKTAPVSYANIVQKVMDEESDRARRTKNFVIYGSQPTENDETLVNNMLDAIGVPTTFSTKRIGGINSEGQQLLHVVCKDEATRNKILKNAKKLRDKPTTKDLYINADMTKAEIKMRYSLRMELKKKRQDDPENEFMIKRNQVIQVKK